MSRYRGLLKWVPGKDCWEISIADHEQNDVRIQPRDVFNLEVLQIQLRAFMIRAKRVELTAYTCEVYCPAGSGFKLPGEALRFMLLLRARYLLYGGRRIEWHLYRQRD